MVMNFNAFLMLYPLAQGHPVNGQFITEHDKPSAKSLPARVARLSNQTSVANTVYACKTVPGGKMKISLGNKLRELETSNHMLN